MTSCAVSPVFQPDLLAKRLPTSLQSGAADTRTLPKSVKLIFAFLARAIRQIGRLQAVGSETDAEVELFRTDAALMGRKCGLEGGR